MEIDVKKKVKGAVDAAGDSVAKGKELVDTSKKAIIDALDENGNGEIDIEDIIIKGFKTPGVRIDRSTFLRKELWKNYPEEVVNDAIVNNPAHAGISVKEIDVIADHVIQNERLGVTGISAALGAPGGAAMVATVPADIIQYYGYMLRAAQKMLYLYGFPEIVMNENEQTLDSETINMIIICLGTMFGVAGAKNAILGIAKALGKGVSKKIMSKALTKGTVYPIIKQVAKWFSIRMTKQILANAVSKGIVIVGGVIGGTMTYATFKPCCNRLKNALQDTMLSNPDNHISSKEEDKFVIDIEATKIDD